MKKSFALLAAAILGLGILTAAAQPAGPPSFSGDIDKLFGDNQSFTAAIEIQTTDPRSGAPITMPGKLSLDNGKSRFEMNMSEMKGGNLPPGAAAQMKAMGLDRIVSISLPGKKASYLIYPGMQSYVENPLADTTDDTGTNNSNMAATAIGKETIDGHDCVKNHVVLTDKNGVKSEYTAWDATDLNNFPVQIESSERGSTVTMIYTDVSLQKPDASVFVVPDGFTKYSSPQEMMQAMIAKKMGGAPGQPPGP